MVDSEIDIASLPVASPGLIGGVLLLFETREFSCGADLDPSRSAVALDELAGVGMKDFELSWAMAKGFIVRLPQGVGDGGAAPRTPPDGYMLSPDGVRYLRALAVSVGLVTLQAQAASARPLAAGHTGRAVEQSLGGRAEPPGSTPVSTPSPHPALADTTPPMDAPQPERSPHWLAERRELYFASHLVKRYRVPASNQETVLSVFEEEGWPYRIDDPLPGRVNRDPKRRLHETIRSLNRNQRTPQLHFFSLGAGVSICWEPAKAEDPRGFSAGSGELTCD